MAANGFVFDIKKYSINDGPGIRTTVFLKGCPLKCWWCHNPESQRTLPEEFAGCSFKWNLTASTNRGIIGTEISVDELMIHIEKDIPFYEESGGGVTFSGGEPMLQINFLHEILDRCKKKDIHTAIDTTGYTDFSNFEMIYDLTDLFLYDLKLMNEDLHKQYTGVPNALVKENLFKLSSHGNKVILRIPIVPNITDTNDNLEEMIEFISSLKNIRSINLLPYHKSAENKYAKMNIENKLSHIITPTAYEMNSVKNKFETLNLPVKIGG